MKKSIIALLCCLAVYLANARSGIFHYDYCYTIKRPDAPWYHEYYDRDEAINDGYRPCKRCQP